MKNGGALPLGAVLRWLAHRKAPEPPWRTEVPPPDDFQPTDVHVRAAPPVGEPASQALATVVERRSEPMPPAVRLQKLEDAIHQAELRVDRMRRLTDRLARGPQEAHAYGQHALACSLSLMHELIRARSDLQRRHFASIRAQLSGPGAGTRPVADMPGEMVGIDPAHTTSAAEGDPSARRQAG